MRTPSLAVGFKSENARLNEENRQLRESWERCKANNAILESLLRESLKYNVMPLELRERIQAQVGETDAERSA